MLTLVKTTERYVPTQDRFRLWLETSEVGDVCCYHREDEGQDNLLTRRAAMTAAFAGKVFLFQRRGPDGGFRYMAKKLSPEAGRALAPKGRSDGS